MKYDSWKYLFPPRPESAIPPDMLAFYEKRGWVCQYKKNGTCTIIGVSPDRKLIAINRHQENHKAWQLTQHIKDALRSIFTKPLWYVVVAEIMHSKTPTIKDTIFIHDILVHESEYLVGTTFKERQEILNPYLLTNVETKTHYVCDTDGKVWFAKIYDKGFADLFRSIKEPKIDEGLVLKDPNGKLRSCDRADANSSWQVKCRHSTKSYQF